MLGILGFFFSKQLGITLKKKYPTPNTNEEQAMISHVYSQPTVSLRAPPRIGAIIHPIA